MSDEILRAIETLKSTLYQDKVYSALSLLSLRSEPDLSTLPLSELRVFSQNGEDGVLFDLVSALDPPNFFVSIGGGDGWSSNTRLWSDVFGWSGVIFEADGETYHDLSLRNEKRPRVVTVNQAVTPEKVNELLESAQVPKEFGILDIDIDGQDYWVWEALLDEWKPHLIVCEYNSHFGNKVSVVEEKGHSVQDMTSTWGASLRALEALGKSKGYDLVYTEMAGVNAFFVRSDLNPGLSNLIERVPNYGLRGLMHPRDVTHPRGGDHSRPICEVGG